MTPERRAAETAAITHMTSVVTSERYTGQVQWSKSGKLQQRIEITQHSPFLDIRHEWRDVPTESDA